jgi:cytochrome P450
MASVVADPPGVTPEVGRQALRALLRGENLLGALQVMHASLGDIFELPMPGFRSVVLVGPEAARFLMVQAAGDLSWRIERDPVVRLLRHGLLVEDGAGHDISRNAMTPALHRRRLPGYVDDIVRSVDDVTSSWRAGQTLNLPVELRKVALLSLTRTLFGVDIAPDLQAVWKPILASLRYISPGAWIIWPGVPRLGFTGPLCRLDKYLFDLIAAVRAAPRPADGSDNLITLLIDAGLSDDLVRDQLLTMLIAGHDTSTAMLTWALVQLAQHPDILDRARGEVDTQLQGAPPGWVHIPQLRYIDSIVKETLRLNPPIHTANRLAIRDIVFNGHRIEAGTRVLFSIYLTHRHPSWWPEPERFLPERFAPGGPGQAAFTYVPFGGGDRICIGAAFAQLEAKLILARLLQQFEFKLLNPPRRARMGATLDPSPDPRMVVGPRGQT